MDIFYALKRYESTEVDRKTWLHVPPGVIGPPTVTPRPTFVFDHHYWIPVCVCSRLPWVGFGKLKGEE